MNKYEIVYIIFRSSLASEELESKLEKFHSLLTRDAGQISAVEHWGKRQLAYPVDKERNGNYVVAQFETEPGSLPDFERILKLDDQILRYLIVLSEGELAIPPSMRRESNDRPGYGAAPRESSKDAASEPDTKIEPDAASEDADGEDADGEPDAASEPDADEETESEPEVTAEEAPEEEERPPTDVASDAEELAAPVDEAGEAEEAEERSSSDA
jgi:small subunit ribosomal protein S6